MTKKEVFIAWFISCIPLLVAIPIQELDNERCWYSIIGGTSVGLAVAVQGYISANPKKFQKVKRQGISKERYYLYYSYCVSVVGTLLWAWGEVAFC